MGYVGCVVIILLRSRTMEASRDRRLPARRDPLFPAPGKDLETEELSASISSWQERGTMTSLTYILYVIFLIYTFNLPGLDRDPDWW
jgi:hypothetical protein